MKTIHREKVSLQQCLSTCSLRRLNTVKFFRAFSPLAPRLSNGKQQQVFSESCLHIKAFVATQRDSRFVFFLYSVFHFRSYDRKHHQKRDAFCVARLEMREGSRSSPGKLTTVFVHSETWPFSSGVMLLFFKTAKLLHAVNVFSQNVR